MSSAVAVNSVVLGVLTLSRLMLVMIAVLLLANAPLNCRTSSTLALHSIPQQTSVEGLGGISDCIGDLILAEDFRSAPLGFNNSQWNLITINSPSLAWMNNESLDLWGERFKSVLLRSNQVFGPGTVADINVSFTSGSCYLFLGWCDDWRDSRHDWVANGRECENGVFVDCWDGELFLVAYDGGERTVAHIETNNLVGWHNLKIEWTESLVRLEIDDVPAGFVSNTIPESQIPVTFMVSGHHQQVEPGRLSLESLGVYEYYRASTSLDPEIILLRPENDSVVNPCSVIDFEVRGSATNLTYLWEEGRAFEVGAPWDVQVPSLIVGREHALPTTLHLTVDATDAEGHRSSHTFTFMVDNLRLDFGVWFMPREPTADGITDVAEAQAAGNLEVGFMSECGMEERVNLLAGYTSDSLYVAIKSPVPDSYYSRATLFVDGDADYKWTPESSDIAVTVPSPSADATFSCILGVADELGSSITCNASESHGFVIYEYLIPLACLSINPKEGVALGIRISHGGYNLDFPSKEGLVIIYSLGVAAPIQDSLQQSFVGGILIFSAGIIGLSLYAIRRDTYYLENATDDERLQRIRTLLLSYEHIDSARLSRMMDLENGIVESLVEELIAEGFPVYHANGEFVRSRKTVKQGEDTAS